MNSLLLRLTVFVAGMSVMGVELAASRLLAPYFGTSLVVWTCLIGIIMVALAFGYAAGGRRADRHPDAGSFYRTVLAAGVLTLAIPTISGPLLSATLATPMLGAILGAFLAVALLFALPVALMGMVTPYAIRLSAGPPEDAGRAAGSIAALSTAGSIVGTFLPGFLLVPHLGTRATIHLFGALLLAVALVGLSRRGAAALVLLSLAALTGSSSPVKVLPGMVDGRESLYHFIQVIERAEDDPPRRRRLLVLNEGRAIHSIHDPDAVEAPLVGAVWDAMNVVPVLAYQHRPMRGALVGLAAGTAVHQWLHFFGAPWDLRVDGVEIDAEVLAVGRLWFGLAGDEASGRLATHTEDGRVFLRRQPRETYAFVLTDAYRQPYIPFHLATREYFELVRDRLQPGGIAAINVGATDTRAPLFRALLSTLSIVFGEVRYVLVANPGSPFDNHLVLAGKGPVPWERLDPLRSHPLAEVLARSGNEALPRVFRESRRRLHPFTAFDPSLVLTDDRAPVEFLTDTMIYEYLAAGGAVPGE